MFAAFEPHIAGKEKAATASSEHAQAPAEPQQGQHNFGLPAARCLRRPSGAGGAAIEGHPGTTTTNTPYTTHTTPTTHEIRYHSLRNKRTHRLYPVEMHL